MKLTILYQDNELAVIDKEAGMPVLREGPGTDKTVADLIIDEMPEALGEEYRYGIVHRLDKDTSGVLLVAKTKEMYEYLQEQFQTRKVKKEYTTLVTGIVKENNMSINAPLGRAPSDRRKQKAYSLNDPTAQDKREAITEYRVIQRFKDYTLLSVFPKTGRKHQLRAHLTYINHPIAGDKLYAFKNQPVPEGLERQFLHATSLSIALPSGTSKEFHSELPQDLKTVLESIQA
tara:strand:- start:126 stop:821 length:696 start_codon:yes stop_codon:yes gene_type:complete